MKTTNIPSYQSTWLLPFLFGALMANAADDPKPGRDSAGSPATQRAEPVFLVADFEKEKPITLAETPWEVFTDSFAGGKSSLRVSVSRDGANRSKHALLLAGKLTADFQWGGYAGVRGLLQKDGGPKNMSQFTGVQFYARGDGKSYRVLVAKEDVKDFNHFYAEFKAPAEWTLIQIPFSKLAQSPYFGTQVKWSPENVTAVGFIAQGEPGSSAEVKLEIDNIGFYSQKGTAPSVK